MSTLRTTLILVVFLFSMHCTQEQMDLREGIFGRWQCVGFGQTVQNESLSDDRFNIRKISPTDYADYALTFRKDGTFFMQSSQKMPGKPYRCNPENNTISLPHRIPTNFASIRGDLLLYSESLKRVHSFEIKDKKLKLFYGDPNKKGKYLLFKPI